MNTQEKRIHNIQLKFNIITELIKGKDIILVDDSIVRGNTLRYLVETLKNRGARKIWVCSASPQILYKNIYGIDIPDKKLLIAYDNTNEEISIELGADGVIFQTLEGLVDSIRDVNPELDKFETSVFTGKYI
jgi:amidophosphoribosyltransferase